MRFVLHSFEVRQLPLFPDFFFFKSFISLKEKYILAYNADTLCGDAINPLG